MNAHQRIAVAGATGRLGRHVVDVLEERGHDVVAISRSAGADVTTGEGLEEALTGVESVIDAATGPSPEQKAATEFFTTAAQNLQQVGERAGVRRIVVVSIIGTDRFTGGYGAAKQAHERAALSGPHQRDVTSGGGRDRRRRVRHDPLLPRPLLRAQPVARHRSRRPRTRDRARDLDRRHTPDDRNHTCPAAWPGRNNRPVRARPGPNARP